MKAVGAARAAIVEYDDAEAVLACLRRNVFPWASELLMAEESADIWSPRKHCWGGAMRAIRDTWRNVILENMGDLLKHPRSWVRLRCRQE